MTINLGDLSGPAVPAVSVAEFGWFGATLRAHPDIGELVLVEFIEGALKIDEDSPQAIVAVKGFMRSCVHPDDFEEFWALAIAHRLDSNRLMAFSNTLITSVIEAQTERPTSLPSDSSDGPTNTDQKSEDGSSSGGVVRRLELAGRPDLATSVQTSIDARVSATG